MDTINASCSSFCEQPVSRAIPFDRPSGRKKGRVDVERNGVAQENEYAFLAEINYPFYADEFDGNIEISAEDDLYFEIKYPEAEDVEGCNYADVTDYITEYMKAVWQTLETGQPVNFYGQTLGFEDLVDIQSFIDYYLVNEILQNGESGFRSTYCYKRIGEKLKFGPVWDFDNLNESLLQETSIFKRFLSYENYYNLVCARFDQIKTKIDEVISILKSNYDDVCAVGRIDLRFWKNNEGFGQCYRIIYSQLTQRSVYLDYVFNKPHAEFLEILNG